MQRQPIPPTLGPGTRFRFTRGDWLTIAVAALTLVPFSLVRFSGLAQGHPLLISLVLGMAIIAAAFFLSWATEGLETVVPQSVALALLALIEVAPEYAFEVLLAYRGQTELAAASMTGANRLLLGLGWPLIMVVAFLSARRKGQRFTEIQLDARNAPELLFLLLASLYAFVLVVKRSFSLFDSAILIAIYVAYILTAFRQSKRRPAPAGVLTETDRRSNSAASREPPEDTDEGDEGADIGVAARLKHLPPATRTPVIILFLLAGAYVLLFGAEPFIDAVLQVARQMGVSQFILIQWVAPFLSEFPESLTAFIWAGMIVFAGKGLSNLISSKLNQWTLLIAAIPLAYSVGRGHIASLPLTAQSVDEVFLTAAQSLFGLSLLLTFRFTLRGALLLAGLFLMQFFIPVEGVHVALGWLYLALTAGFLLLNRRKLHLAELFRAGRARG
ncbi:hypothetical protein [Deinococcus humi]|uniref:Cation:H+ antiporter n=1 Tax=Deinococcus humi TaxID=662880 RepID=A0A7W8JX14_9DEIO|nr:hypothetical protein [Deinococcus humi]MBB5364388.1 cation:H+ antiporter [Deinococcus humi]GGO33301.1 sodium/calcium exchanger family protein [Deinococcus humi]